MESNKRLSEAAALQIIQQCQRLEADFAEQFTAVIQAEGNCQVYNRARKLHLTKAPAKGLSSFVIEKQVNLRQIT